jgi:hypothetical protein
LNAQKKCEEIIEQLVKDGYRYQVTRKDIEQAIMKSRNIIDERAIDRWIRALITFEYITHISHGIFKINPIKIPNLINNLKEKPQTKIQ